MFFEYFYEKELCTEKQMSIPKNTGMVLQAFVWYIFPTFALNYKYETMWLALSQVQVN